MARGEARFDHFTWKPLGRRDAVVADLDLTVGAGEHVLLVGPSGSGKSTMLLGLADALGTSIAGDLTGSASADGTIGLLLQNPADAVVAEHLGRDVAFGLENLRVDRAALWPRVDAVLEAVGLRHGRGHPTGALSGGEQQRLALAGVLALKPDVLLLDEPTAMLDADTAATVREAIVSAAHGRTMIVVEHRIGPWLEHVDRVVVLSAHGQVVADQDVASFLSAAPPPGVWAPGMKAPVPLAIPSGLARPDVPGPEVRLSEVSVDLVLRTLRGALRTRALSEVSAALVPGDVTAFTGPSGAGKSTAVAVAGGLIRVSAGEVSPDLRALRSRELATIMGWVPQNPEHGFMTRTVADEVGHTARRLGVPVGVDRVLEVFGLTRFAPSNPYRLSGGEQRRLAIAAALAHRPRLVLLDEPTVGQDPATWAAVAGWIAAAGADGATVAVSTHDPELPRQVEHQLVEGIRV